MRYVPLLQTARRQSRANSQGFRVLPTPPRSPFSTPPRSCSPALCTPETPSVPSAAAKRGPTEASRAQGRDRPVVCPHESDGIKMEEVAGTQQRDSCVHAWPASSLSDVLWLDNPIQGHDFISHRHTWPSEPELPLLAAGWAS